MQEIYLPVPDGLNALFHRRATETGRLHLQQCLSCATFRHPPRYVCAACFSEAWEFAPSAEEGTVYSLVVSHVTLDPAWKERTPFVTAVVHLDEGPRIVADVRNIDPEWLTIGRRVSVHVEAHGTDFAMLWIEAPG